MKKTIILVTALAGSAMAILYLMGRKKGPTMQANREPEKRSHHITEVFAKAKT